jgi:hypothetical protein
LKTPPELSLRQPQKTVSAGSHWSAGSRALTDREANGKCGVTPRDDDSAVPTLHREAGHAFRFRAGDREEPPHVHVEGGEGHAKFWLEDGRLADIGGYNRRELATIGAIVAARRSEWLRRWHEYFG